MSGKKIIIFGIIVCLLATVSFFCVSGFEKGNNCAPSPSPDYNEGVKSADKETDIVKNEIVENKKSETPLPEISEESQEEEKEAEETETEQLKEKIQEDEKIANDARKELTAETLEAEKEEEDAFICSLIVRCDSVFKNPDKLSESKRALIPQNGIFLSCEKVSFSEGESVFDVLQRELKNNGIHFEYVKNPMYNSVYIEGIGNLYEFDMGDMSGWLYKVNGVKPTYGSSQYKIEKGDKIEFVYSLNYMDE